MQVSTITLTGKNLSTAVAKAEKRTLTEVSFLIGAMSFDELIAYVDAHVSNEDLRGFNHGTACALRDVILETFVEPDYIKNGQLTLDLIEREGMSTGTRVVIATGKTVWRAESESEHHVAFGDTLTEAALRCYLLGATGDTVDIIV